MAMSGSGILPVCNWHTTAGKLPEQSRGSFKIVKRHIEEDKQLDMNGIFGYQSVYFCCPDNAINVLYDGDKDPASDPGGVWMSDSPYEYYGMAQLAARARPGKVLVGGLGLGILANMLANREDIDGVTVVELSDEVIHMVKPHLHPKVKVVHGDFLGEMSKLERQGIQFDTVVSDIYKSCGPEEDDLFIDTNMAMEENFPDAEILHWCFQERYENELLMIHLASRGKRA